MFHARPSVFAIFCMLPAIAIVACSTDDGENRGVVGDGGQTVFVDASIDLLNAFCDFSIRCENPITSQSPVDPVICHPTIQEEIIGQWQLIADGGASQDHEALSACKSAVNGQESCSYDPIRNAACWNLFIGTVEQDEACSHSEHCGDGLFCATDDHGYCGTCRLYAVETESCAEHSCAPGFFCDTEALCEPLHGRGQGCAQDSDCQLGLSCLGGLCGVPSAPFGSPCSGAEARCDYGLFCQTQGEDAGTCQRAAQSGDACSAELPCGELGDRCVEGTCLAIAVSGEECSSDGQCSDYFACEQGVCAPFPILGERCRDWLGCADSLCRGGLCREGLDGDACEHDRVCQSAFCSPHSGTCEQLIAQGGECLGGDCRDGLVCTVDGADGIGRCSEVVCGGEEPGDVDADAGGDVQDAGGDLEE